MTSKEHLASLQLLIGERRVDSSSQDVHQTSGDRRDDRPRTFGFSDCLALVNQVDPEQYQGTSGHLDQCDCLSQPCHCEEGAEDGRGGEDEQSADRPDSDQRRRECERRECDVCRVQKQERECRGRDGQGSRGCYQETEQKTAAEDVPELRDEDGPEPLARNPTQVVVKSPYDACSEYQQVSCQPVK